jgi:hypothetical protein
VLRLIVGGLLGRRGTIPSHAAAAGDSGMVEMQSSQTRGHTTGV